MTTGPARLRHLRHRELDGLARDRLDHLKHSLETGLTAAPGAPAQFTFTADFLTNQLIIAGEDTLAVGNPRVILIGDDLPLGLEAGTIYWLRDTGLNLYTLHPTLEDAAGGTNTVAFTDDGTGTLTIALLD